VEFFISLLAMPLYPRSLSRLKNFWPPVGKLGGSDPIFYGAQKS